MSEIKTNLEEVRKKIPNIKINGAVNARLPGNSNISFEGIDGNDLLLELDNVGIEIPYPKTKIIKND